MITNILIKRQKAMDVMGVPKDGVTEIFQILAAVLHLGNLSFKPNPQQKDSCQIADKNGLEFEIIAF